MFELEEMNWAFVIVIWPGYKITEPATPIFISPSLPDVSENHTNIITNQ